MSQGQLAAGSRSRSGAISQLFEVVAFFPLKARRLRTGHGFAIVFAWLSLLCLALGCQLAGHEVAPREADPAPRVLRIGTSGDYAPFSDWGPATEETASARGVSPQGFSIDVAQSFAEAEGFEIEWVRFRWPELLADVAAGRFELAISGITVRPERSVAGRFSLPLTTSGAIVLVPEASALDSPSDLDRAEIRLAVNAGGHLERVTRKLFPAASIEPVEANAQVLGRLQQGLVHAVVTDTLEAPHWERRADIALRRIGPLTTDRKAALVVATRGDLARRFDAWLLDAEANGSLPTLRRWHGLPDTRTAEIGEALLASFDERLALMPDVARVKRLLGRPIEDRAVEARVIAAALRSVEQEARVQGTTAPDADAVASLFRAQIEAAKWIQAHAREIDGDAAPAQTPPSEMLRSAARRELEDALRPALIRIGDRIAGLLARASSRRAVRPDIERTRRALEAHGLPESIVEELHAALVRLLPSATATASAPPPPRAASDITSNE